MSTSITVRRYLDTQDVPYSVVSYPAGAAIRDSKNEIETDGIPGAAVARAIILKDVSGLVMAVIPVTHRQPAGNLNSVRSKYSESIFLLT